MSVLRDVLNWFRPQARDTRAVPENPQNLDAFAHIIRRFAGVHVTVEQALQVSAVWACIDVISKALASSDWKVYRRLRGGDHDELPDDALMWILNTRPNPDMTAINFRQGMLILALAMGNSYAEIVRDGAGRIVELWPLMSDRTEMRRNDAGELFYRYHNESGDDVDFDPMDIFHVAGPGISGLMGDHLIARAAKTIARSIAAEKFSIAYFENGVSVSGVLTTPTGLDEETYKQLKEELEKRHTSPERAMSPMLLEGGMDWKPMGSNAKEAQLVESEQFQIEQICRWYGVPPHRVQHLISGRGLDIEQLGIEFVQSALTPWAKRIEQEADYKLFAMRGPLKFTRHDLEWLTQGSANDRATAFQIMRRNGVLTANEWLRKVGMNSIGPEGDIRVIDANMVKLEDVGKNISAPPPGTGGNVETDTQPGGGRKDPPAPDGNNRAVPRHSLANSDALLRDAAVTLVASGYQRYMKRIAARRDDLERKGKSVSQVLEHLEDFRAKERQRIWDELGSAINFLGRICDASADDIRLAAMIGIDEALNSTPEHAARLVVRQLTETKQ